MSLHDQIKEDFKQAMKDQDKERLNVLKMLKSALQNREIEEGGELSDDQVRQVLSKEAKDREESIEQYADGGRDDRADKERRELEVIQEYLPESLSGDELEELVDEVIDEVGASDQSDMGQVMGEIMPEIRGRAEGDDVRELVTEKLS